MDQNLLYDVLSRCQSWSCFSTVIREIWEICVTFRLHSLPLFLLKEIYHNFPKFLSLQNSFAPYFLFWKKLGEIRGKFVTTLAPTMTLLPSVTHNNVDWFLIVGESSTCPFDFCHHLWDLRDLCDLVTTSVGSVRSVWALWIVYSDFIVDFSKILRPSGRPRLFSVTQISQISQICYGRFAQNLKKILFKILWRSHRSHRSHRFKWEVKRWLLKCNW